MDKKVEIGRTISLGEANSDAMKIQSTVDTQNANVDVGAAYAQAALEQPYTREEEVAVRWRLDRRIMPILFFNVILASVDKTSTSTGSLYGMLKDNDLQIGDRYSWVGSAFYFGYLVASLPAAWAMQKYPIAKVIVCCQLVWGFLLLGMGFVSSFRGILVMRIILGMLEAPIIPGGVLMLSMWYPRKDLALRLAFYYTGFAQLITGPVGYGVGHVHHVWFNPWRLFFWILGGFTVLWSLFSGLVLPDSPVKAKFLSEREKTVVIARIQGDQTGIENKKWKWDQVREALIDPKTWLLFFFNLFISTPNGGLTNLTPLIIKGLGYSSTRAALIVIPSGIMETVAGFLCNGSVFLCMRWFGNRYQIRGVAMIFGIVVGLIATVFLYTLPLTALHNRLVALYFSFFYLGPYIVSLGLVTINTSGYTKKVILNALCFVSNCVANIIGPQFFIASQAPLYPLGTGVILGCYCLSMITILLYMAYCAFENRRRDKMQGVASEDSVDVAFLDLTDMQNPHFRYVW